MGRKISRQFCQWDSLKTTPHNTISLESKFFDQGLKKYLSLKISNFNIKNIWPLKNILRTLGDVKLNFGQLLFSTPSCFFTLGWARHLWKFQKIVEKKYLAPTDIQNCRAGWGVQTIERIWTTSFVSQVKLYWKLFQIVKFGKV